LQVATLTVTLSGRPDERAVVADTICSSGPGGLSHRPGDAGRIDVLRDASAILARNTDTDLHPGEAQHIASARLIQFLTTGIDFVKLSALPPAFRAPTMAAR
jgi:hypothetical protein